jgi:hypothetical protein
MLVKNICRTDTRGPRPVLWVGNNLGASIVKVEPLD